MYSLKIILSHRKANGLIVLALLLSLTSFGQSISSSNTGANYCTSQNYIITASAGSCSLANWDYTGQWTIKGTGGSGSTTTITVQFASSGILTAFFACGTNPDIFTLKKTLSVNVVEVPTSVSIVVQPTQVTAGQEITLTASANTIYATPTYTWTGTGLQSTTSYSVKANPPEGTTRYTASWSYTNSNCSSSGSTYVEVTAAATPPPSLPPLTPAPDQTYCREIGLVAVSSLRQDVSKGAWSGESISNGSINIGALAIGSHDYTYTRTADGATDQITITVLETVAGTIKITSTETCSAANGSFKLENYSGSVLLWERSVDGGINWSEVPSSATDNINYNESSEAQYRATVRNGSCLTLQSPIVTVKPQASQVGTLSASDIQFTCGRATGTLMLNIAEGTVELQQDSGSGWLPMPNVTLPYSFDVSTQTSFRVKVTNAICPPVFSNTFTALTSTIPGTISTSNGQTEACGATDVHLSVDNQLGSVLRWEYSSDNSNWAPLQSSVGVTSYTHNTSASKNYYRAAVALGNCSTEYTASLYVAIASPTNPGQAYFVREDKVAEVINGKLTFYPMFELRNYTGSIQNWQKSIDSSVELISETGAQIHPVISHDGATRLEVFFAAQVKSGSCDPLVSGQVGFIVNKLFQGIVQITDQTALTAYDGHSYKVATAAGLSLQDGFSFHANSAQEFFIAQDENYSAPPADQNYVLQEIIQKEGIKDDGDVYFLDAYGRVSTYSYADGLDRPLQQVQRKAAPGEKDLVVPVSYDAVGRPNKTYLPYMTETNTGNYNAAAPDDQSQFYKTPPVKIASSDFPFAKKIYEPSPLNRVAEQGAAGTEWQPETGRAVKFEYGTNETNEVKRWRLNASGLPESDFFLPGELVMIETIDEHANPAKEFKNKEGLVILKKVKNDLQWIETYYIYDAFNRPRYVIQPEGVAQLNGNPDQNFLDTWAFQYKYDSRGRLIEKRVPGSNWVYTVYDTHDRVVLTQDGNLREKNKWTFAKYDELNRPVVNGIYTHSEKLSREEMAALVSNDLFNESFAASDTWYGYTNVVFPTQNLEILNVTYYDNYDFVSLFGNGYGYDEKALVGIDPKAFGRVVGLATGAQTKILGAATDQWLKSVTYYDKRYQVIQTVSQNHLDGFDRTSQRYDFAGRVLEKAVVHSKNGADDITVSEMFEYDHMGRLLQVYHQVDNGPQVELKSQNYNAIGQLVEKNLHQKDDGTYFQSIDYRYNIRGWLTHINNAQIADDGGVTNDDGNDFFGFELKYNNPTTLGGVSQFNGNISEALWTTIGNNKQSYAYSYDPLNRLKQAKYLDRINPLNNDRFNEVINGYDNNGNIKGLQRGAASNLMDDLSYKYFGNQLLRVTEDKGDKKQGFIDGTNSGDDYTYDDNGNMEEDQNKGLGNITYNFLNLPENVIKGNDNIQYMYVGTTKLKQVSTENQKTKTTDYSGSFVYEDDVLQFILHEEGRVTMKKNKPVYDYFLKDHLGNTRLTFTTKQETETTTATLDNAIEDSKFLRLDNVRKIFNRIVDRTKDATDEDGYAIRLSGGDAEKIGLAKSLQVLPGDKVHMEVYGKYIDPAEQANWSGAISQLVSAAMSGGTQVVDGGSYNTSTNSLPLPSGAYSGHTDDSAGPNAWLNYIFLNKDFDLNSLKLGAQKLTDFAREIGTNVTHEKLELDFTATEVGYLYVFLSNDSEVQNEEVFFDDFQVRHEKSNIVQVNDYYPFGLSFNSYSREGSVPNTIKLFQNQEHIDDLGLNWDSFKWRNHQPEIGRFFNVDPLSENYVYNSPYSFSENHVTVYVELEGLEKVPVNHDEGFEQMLDKVATNTTSLNRSGSTINVASAGADGKVISSTSIELPSASSQAKVSDHSAKTIGEVAMTAKESSVTISSIKRDAAGQTKAMYDNLEGRGPGQGIVNQKILYRGNVGAQTTISSYVRYKGLQAIAGQFGGTVSGRQIQYVMLSTINNFGVENVTKHASSDPKLEVFDVAPSSVSKTNTPAFVKAAETHPNVNTFFPYPLDPGHHFQIKQP